MSDPAKRRMPASLMASTACNALGPHGEDRCPTRAVTVCPCCHLALCQYHLDSADAHSPERPGERIMSDIYTRARTRCRRER